jgi:hypothetical protein
MNPLTKWDYWFDKIIHRNNLKFQYYDHREHPDCFVVLWTPRNDMVLILWLIIIRQINLSTPDLIYLSTQISFFLIRL